MKDEVAAGPSSFILPSSFRGRLLVLRLSALGDVIHTLPAVAVLRDALPETRIEWAVEAPYRELVEVVGRVSAIPVRMKTWGRGLRAHRAEVVAAVRALRGADVSVDFQGLIKSAVLGRLSGARRRYGFAREAIREKAALLFTNERVAVDTRRHVVEQNLELAAAVVGPRPPAALEWEAFATAEGLDDYRGSIVLLPGAGKANKLWPVARFRELARELGPKALAVWGPGERELAEAIGARVAPPTSLRELAFILRHAQIVVGGDTGPLHLAAALGTKAVGLFGPTSPRRNGPYGPSSRVVDKFHSTKLMDSISVSEVMKTLLQVAAE